MIYPCHICGEPGHRKSEFPKKKKKSKRENKEEVSNDDDKESGSYFGCALSAMSGSTIKPNEAVFGNGSNSHVFCDANMVNDFVSCSEDLSITGTGTVKELGKVIICPKCPANLLCAYAIEKRFIDTPTPVKYWEVPFPTATIAT